MVRMRAPRCLNLNLWIALPWRIWAPICARVVSRPRPEVKARAGSGGRAVWAGCRVRRAGIVCAITTQD